MGDGQQGRRELVERLVEGAPDEAVALLGRLARGLTPAQREDALPSGEVLVDAAEAALELQRWCDGGLTEIASRMATVAGRQLLREAGTSDPGELSRTRRARWRAEAKSVAANELQALTGWGIQTCHDRVGVGLAPLEARQAAMAAMCAGWADFPMVRRWWRRCHELPVPAADRIARAALGPRVDPDGVAARRSFAESLEILEREARRVEGADSRRERRRRAEALDRRDTSATVEDNGTGTLLVDGPASAVAAAQVRLDQAARRLRSGGDERTLAQLRADLALALLVHGTLPAARPGGPGQHSRTSRTEATGGAKGGGAPAEAGVADPGDEAWQLLHGLPSATVEVIVPLEALTDPDTRAVGEIRGFGPISPSQARELALTPGSTLYRLLTDPADGTLLERSTTAYRPDAAMTAQIIAADGHCRGPGCTHPPSACERDHERPHDKDGPTTPANLNLKHGRHHWLKTKRYWDSHMAGDRTVTWHTFFGRCYRTRPQDYRQYQAAPAGLGHGRGRAPAVGHGPDRHDGHDGHDGHDRRHAAGTSALAAIPDQLDEAARDALVYAALAHRHRHEPLGADDDHDQPAVLDTVVPGDLIGRGEPIQLRHRTPGGAVRLGPPPTQPTPGAIIETLTRPEPTPATRR